jgi:site-specific DNA recombinase
MQPDPIPARQEAPALLTDLAVCGSCGQPVRSALLSAGQAAYRCGVDGDQAHLVRSTAPVDVWLGLLVVDRLDRPDAPDLLTDPELPDLYALRAHAAGLRTRRGQLEDAATAGVVDPSAAEAGSARLGDELAAVEDQMIDHAVRGRPASQTGADPVDVAWERLDVERQRAVLRALVDRVVLHPVPPGHRAGDPDVLRNTIVVSWRAS